MYAKHLVNHNSQLHWLDMIEQALAKNPSVISLLYDRAAVLHSIGDLYKAELAYHDLLRADPGNFSGMLELSSLFITQGRIVDAIPLRQALLGSHPHDATAIAGLGEVMLLDGQLGLAEKLYAAALKLAPHHTLVHDGLGRLARLHGRIAEAEAHAQAASDQLAIYPRQFRGTKQPVSLLLFVSEAEGCESTYADRILDESVFLVTKCIIERLNYETPLPEHTLIFNGVTDADRSDNALLRLESLLTSSAVPVLNAPSLVRRTNRVTMSQRLATIDGLVSPKMIELSAEAARDADAPDWLNTQGFSFPFLARVPHYHAGRYFEMVRSADEYAPVIAGFPHLPVLIIGYIDVRDDAGYYHKGRVMVIDGELYPTHLAYGMEWKLHYFSSDMMHQPALRAAEAEFLANPKSWLGERSWTAMQQIAELIGLEYFGIDFACAPGGDLVVFECNAAMVVANPGMQPQWTYRRRAYDACMQAAAAMVKRRIPAYEVAARPSGSIFS